ncbi:MAG: phosphate ABC transporter, permease protein PstA, partial [Deltaproteobacteria bacterium]|nr:phosphate ABC transporter, permease protein PstA [Deltaproteobacteria bacterium]
MSRGFWRSGDPFIWLTGGALGFSVIMILALICIVAANALGFFWPDRLVLAQLQGGGELLGQVIAREEIPGVRTKEGQTRYRTEFQVANRDLYGADFRWVEDEQIFSRS